MDVAEIFLFQYFYKKMWLEILYSQIIEECEFISGLTASKNNSLVLPSFAAVLL